MIYFDTLSSLLTEVPLLWVEILHLKLRKVVFLPGRAYGCNVHYSKLHGVSDFPICQWFQVCNIVLIGFVFCIQSHPHKYRVSVCLHLLYFQLFPFIVATFLLLFLAVDGQIWCLYLDSSYRVSLFWTVCFSISRYTSKNLNCTLKFPCPQTSSLPHRGGKMCACSSHRHSAICTESVTFWHDMFSQNCDHVPCSIS